MLLEIHNAPLKAHPKQLGCEGYLMGLLRMESKKNPQLRGVWDDLRHRGLGIWCTQEDSNLRPLGS